MYTFRKLVLLSSALYVSADVATDIDDATTDIWQIIRDDNSIAPKFVRLGFHDCVGGCDGCVNMENDDNAGLEVPIEALETVVSTYESDSGLSRADIWALAAITGTNFGLNRAGGDRTFFEMTHYGRVNCGDDQTGGTDHELPGPNIDTQELLDFFADNFDFDDQETVAIMGAHTFGTLNRETSGFHATGWVPTTGQFNNRYYEALVGEGSTEEEWIQAPRWGIVLIENNDLPDIPARYQWNFGAGADDDTDTTGTSGRLLVNEDDDSGSTPGAVLLNAIFGDCNCDDDLNTTITDDSGSNVTDDSSFTSSNSSAGDDSSTTTTSSTSSTLTTDLDEANTIMLSSDIALVRTFGDEMSEDGDVACDFVGANRCPVASTLEQMADYRNDNDLWLTDFKEAWEKMLIQGCDTCVAL